jgi:outer membrane lipopolysaccharide assembly protein LptE/RlpB
LNDPTKKAMVVLITQIKNTLLSLEDILLSTSCDYALHDYDRVPEKVKRKPTPTAELDNEEENHLEESLERERLAIMESDKVLKDLWTQGKR